MINKDVFINGGTVDLFAVAYVEPSSTLTFAQKLAWLYNQFYVTGTDYTLRAGILPFGVVKDGYSLKVKGEVTEFAPYRFGKVSVGYGNLQIDLETEIYDVDAQHISNLLGQDPMNTNDEDYIYDISTLGSEARLTKAIVMLRWMDSRPEYQGRYNHIFIPKACFVNDELAFELKGKDVVTMKVKIEAQESPVFKTEGGRPVLAYIDKITGDML